MKTSFETLTDDELDYQLSSTIIVWNSYKGQIPLNELMIVRWTLGFLFREYKRRHLTNKTPL
jgi:hypothetical protein